MKKQNNKIDALKQWLKKHKIVGSIVIAMLLFVAAFSIFKFVTMQHDRKQFNEAEQKLRELKLPKAESTTYNESCSYRSSKELVRTKPNCGVGRVDFYQYADDAGARTVSKSIFDSLRAYGVSSSPTLSSGMDVTKTGEVSENELTVDLPNLVTGQRCYAFFNKEDSSNNRISVSIRCFKEVQFQIFPEY